MSFSVIGTVQMRGAEPFAAPVLETADSSALYVLIFPGVDRVPLSTPGRYRVTGELYRDSWQGRPFAHIRAEDWEPVE